MKQVLYIMQGPSGSGKSTVAQKLASERTVVFSTDDYFYEDGVYVFRPELLKVRHVANQGRTRVALEHGWSVVVDNTNIQRWQARPYVEMAVSLNIPVVFIRCEARWKNIHGVPDAIVDAMWEKLESLSVEGCLTAPYPIPREG